MKKTRRMRALTLFVIAGVVAIVACSARAKDSKSDTMYAGVYLDGVYVGGLTKDEAMEEYDKYIDGIGDLKLTFATDVGTCYTTLDQLNVSVSAQKGKMKIKAVQKASVVIPERKIRQKKIIEKLAEQEG